MTGSGSAVFAPLPPGSRPPQVRLTAGLAGAGMQQYGGSSPGGMGTQRRFIGGRLISAVDPCRGVAKLVKALDFDSGMRGFESFLPCQISFVRLATLRDIAGTHMQAHHIPISWFSPAMPIRHWPPRSPATWASRSAPPRVGRFSDGEVTVEINTNVRARDVFVVQSTCAPTNENLMELLIMVDALKRASAERISAVIPYFGYARQDRRPRSSARADLGQGGGQPAGDRGRRARADHGPARRPDPGLLRHPGRQHLRVAGAAGRPARRRTTKT